MEESVLPSTVAIAPLEPDWNLIRERYLAGDDAQDIAEATGTTRDAIYSRAYRECWKAEALRAICRDEAAVSAEVRLNLVVSVYREARMLGRMSPAREANDARTWAQERSMCIESASKLLRWEEDPALRAKLAKCLDV